MDEPTEGRLTRIYFTDTPELNQAATGSLIGGVISGFDIPSIVLVLFGAGTDE